MKWIEPTVFAKSCGNPDFRSIFGHQRAKNAGTNTKIDRGPETYPISINPRDEMNWANSFREKLWKPCLQTDGRTDGRTDRRTDRHQGESSIPPFHLRWSGGINIWILIKISLKFVPGPYQAINPLSEPMMVSLMMHICVPEPQGVDKRLSK